MKTTYKEIWETQNAIQDAEKVTGLPLTEAVPFAKMIRAIKEELLPLAQERDKMIAELGQEVEGPNGQKVKGVISGTDAAVELDKQMKELLSTEITMDFNKVKITETNDINIPMNVLMAFMPFLDIKKPKAPDNQKK